MLGLFDGDRDEDGETDELTDDTDADSSVSIPSLNVRSFVGEPPLAVATK